MDLFVVSSSQPPRPPSPRGYVGGSRPVVGPLKALGYAVGEHGLSIAERQRILRFALEGDLPRTIAADVISEWGDKNSARRRFKIINSLKGFIFLQVRRRDGSVQAIEDWTGDLEWFVTTLAPSPR